MKRRKEPRSVITWNAGPRPSSEAVASLIEMLTEHPVDAVGIMEPPHIGPVDRVRLRRLGYRIIATKRAGRDVRVLVHRGVKAPSVGSISHYEPWIGPHAGIPHKGRTFPVLDWADLRLVLPHRTPGGPSGGKQTRGANKDSWDADRRAIAAAVRGHKRVAVLGDQNATARELAPEYAAMGLTVHATFTRVDHGAERGLPNLTGRRIGNYGSDHPAILWRLDPEKEAS